MTMRGTPSLAVPQTQNTAPVFEFNCLYTHDIRRKQKRWQDGFLRFHTFNKRIMVYDVPRNFIGDAHWSGEELQDGDEVTLEKDGVLVQVAESVGRTETDLTELIRSKRKTPSVAASSSPIRGATHQPPPRQYMQPARQGSTNPVQLKHRSLNALLGTPRGRIGKAVLPTKSPFEERLEKANAMWEAGRPQKRQRIDEASLRHRTGGARPNLFKQDKHRAQHTLQQRQAKKEIVDLCSDSSDLHQFFAGLSDDAMASPQPSPQHQRKASGVPVAVRSSSPAFQTQQAPEIGRCNTADLRGMQSRDRSESRGSAKPTSDLHCRGKSGDIDHSARNTNPSDAALQREKSPPTERSCAEQRERERTKITSTLRPGKTLRVAASAPKKKTLLCQDQLSATPRASLLDESSEHLRSKHFGKTSQRHQLDQRLARIEKKAQRTRETTSETIEAAVEEDNGVPALPDTLHLESAQEETATLVNHHKRSPRPVIDPGSSHRQLRRVVSESYPLKDNTRNNALPPRPVPAPASSSSGAHRAPCDPLMEREAATVARLAPRTKKPLDRAVSLNLASNGTSTVILRREFQPPKPPKPKAAVPDVVANPWSREAFDLFTWRPPGWDEENWCIKAGEAATVKA